MTTEDRAEIKTIVEAVLTAENERRREERRVAAAQEPKLQKTTKLYLISFGGCVIAFPDEHGRAILSQSIYGWITMAENETRFWGGGPCKAIAHGDGHLLKEPVNVVLTGASVIALVEVSEALLKS